MRRITIFLVMIIIFNFIYMSFFDVKVYGTTDNPSSGSGQTESGTNSGSGDGNSDDEEGEEEESDSPMMTMEEYKSLDEGKATIGDNEKTISIGDSDTGSASSKFATFLSTVTAVCAKVITNVTTAGGFYYTDSEFSAQQKGLFTIQSLVFGEYLLFNAKPYQKSTDLNPDIEPKGILKTVDTMKKGGAVLSKFISRLAMAIALPLILFSLVKMINSKKARDLAAWKKILVRWILCFALAYFYEYILAAIDLVCDSLIDAFWHYRKSLESDRNYLAFEVTVEGSIIKAINDTGGVTSMGYAIEFFMLVLLQVLFLIKYVARTFIIMIFFIITPIIIIIHSVNLMLGKDSNILGEFFKTYLILSFMQPFHALVYIVFFFALSEIVINIPILGILFLYALYRAGNIAKAMFGWELGSSIISMNKE